MTVEHHYPSALIPIVGKLEISSGRPDAIIWRTPFGPALGRVWSSSPISALKAAAGEVGKGSDGASALAWLARHVGVGARPLWILEPISRAFRGLLCGPELADGTRTAFFAPVFGGTVSEVFVEGVRQNTGWSFISSANSLSAAECNAEGGTTGLTVSGAASAVSSVSYLARFGTTSAKVTCSSGAVAKLSVSLAPVVDFTADEWLEVGLSVYLGGADVAAGLEVVWKNDAAATVGTWTDENTAVIPGTWNEFNYAGTVPATAVIGTFSAYKSGSTAPFFVGARWASRGLFNGFERAFHPSYAPGVVVFDTPPAIGARVSAACSGYRLWYGSIDSDSVSYSLNDDGAYTGGDLRITEVTL